MKEADKIKLRDGDEIIVPLDLKSNGDWKGHFFDVCCNCGYRHHNVFRVEIEGLSKLKKRAKKIKPQLTFETYADLYGSKLKKRKK